MQLVDGEYGACIMGHTHRRRPQPNIVVMQAPNYGPTDMAVDMLFQCSIRKHGLTEKKQNYAVKAML